MRRIRNLRTLATISALFLTPTSCKHADSASTAMGDDRSEANDPDLESHVQAIKEDAARTVTALNARLGSPAARHFHAKGLCAKGKLIIDPKAIPAFAQKGLFKSPGTYAVFARFSNGIPIKTVDDKIPSVFGFGLKVLGVPGEKYVMTGSTKPPNQNQDWNMATGRTFPIPSAEVYAAQRRASTAPLESRPAALAAFADKYPEVAAALEAARSLLDTYRHASYHSQVALHFDDQHVAKFSVAPCDHSERRLTAAEVQNRHENYLLRDLRDWVMQKSTCFMLRAQIRPANEYLTGEQSSWAERFPVANPTVDWDPAVIKFTTLGRIEIPAQSYIDDLQETCENLSINPGNALYAFRPIDSDTLMASRFRGAYEGSVSTRTALNQLNQTEPLAPHDVEAWLKHAQ